MSGTRRTPRVAAALGVAAMLLAGCGEEGGGSEGGGGELDGASLTVGSKEFTESIILGQITILALKDAGADVEDQTGISGSATVREALEADEIDMYWDYTGTGWVNILGNSPTDYPEDLFAAVAEADAENGISWLEPAPFEDTYALAVTSEFAEENDLTTISDAAALLEGNPDAATICAASEFINRDDGLPGLEKAYGIDFEVVELDLNLVYTQVGDTCNFAEVTSTDGRVLSNDLTVLEDDQDFFIEYRGALTMRAETLEKYPAIAEIMAPISEALTDEVVTDLNAQVDVEGEQPEDVAEEWLESEGLL